MYPNLYFFFKEVFGVEIAFLKLINTFGFFVALCFIAAAYVVNVELKRKQQSGLLVPVLKQVVVGAPASIKDLVSNFLMGFVFGYKILGVAFVENALANPQAYILSSQGSGAIGILSALFFAGWKWYEMNKLKLAKPETRTIRIWPNDRVGDMVIIAAIAGFAGAKIFHNLENWNEFISNPLDALIAFSGLTFYGGLICAAAAIAWFARKNKIVIIHLADAFAPALMLGYAIGRIGCQVAGDGDWGILNSAYVCNANGQPIAATAAQFNAALQQHHGFYMQQFGSVANVKHVAFSAFAGLPDWLFAYAYPHNVISEGVALANCDSLPYCAYLPLPVFPTPFYETVMCLVLFGILWTIRKKINKAGMLSGIYLMMNGCERFLIEQIRVNTKYESLPFQPTQAQLISVLMFISGALLVVWAQKKNLAGAHTNHTDDTNSKV